MASIYEALYFWVAALDRGLLWIVGVPIAISLLYIVISRRQPPVSRVLGSAHGVLFVLAFVYAASVKSDALLLYIPFAGLLVAGVGSVLYSLWSARKKWYVHFVHVLTLSYGSIILYRGILALGTEYITADCWLPVLTIDAPSRTLAYLGDDRRRDFCPMPVPRVLQVQRSYGTLEFEVWGSPHRLYMVGERNDGEALRFAGDEVQPYRNTSGSWLERYTDYRRFVGHDFVNIAAPLAFSVTVIGPDGTALDELSFAYRTERCSCWVPAP